ncbi:MAG: hypothetical protein K2M87_04285 [Muribaculaceae bacterium]|nr:hypothetical protein [Muribaculaceae bacterium]
MAKENLNEVAEKQVENVENCCECGENCKCGAGCKFEKVAHCVYKAVTLLTRVATVCAICHVAKEVHKVHKAIEHKKHF